MTRGGTGAHVEIDINKLIDLLIVVFTAINYFVMRHNNGRIDSLHDRVTEVEDNAQDTAKKADKGSV